MNRTETVLLLRKIRAYKPAQTMDEYTPDAWQEVLAGVPADDAMSVVQDLARELTWIGVDDVAQRAKAITSRRINDGEADLIPPPDLATPEQVNAYQDWLKGARARLAAGETAQQINDRAGFALEDLKPRNMAILGRQPVKRAPR